MVLHEFIQEIMAGRLEMGFRTKIRLLKLWQKSTGANLKDQDRIMDVAREIPLYSGGVGFVGRCAMIAAYEEEVDNLERSEMVDFYFQISQAREDWDEMACL